MFFFLSKVLFSGFLQSNVDGQNNLKYLDVAPLISIQYILFFISTWNLLGILASLKVAVCAYLMATDTYLILLCFPKI